MKILLFTSPRASARALALKEQITNAGDTACLRSAPDFRRSDGVEACGAIWVEPFTGKQAEIENAYLEAGAQLYAPEQVEATQTPLERIEQHFANVTTLSDETPVHIPTDPPTEDRPARSRRRKGR